MSNASSACSVGGQSLNIASPHSAGGRSRRSELDYRGSTGDHKKRSSSSGGRRERRSRTADESVGQSSCTGRVTSSSRHSPAVSNHSKTLEDLLSAPKPSKEGGQSVASDPAIKSLDLERVVHARRMISKALMEVNEDCVHEKVAAKKKSTAKSYSDRIVEVQYRSRHVDVDDTNDIKYIEPSAASDSCFGTPVKKSNMSERPKVTFEAADISESRESSFLTPPCSGKKTGVMNNATHNLTRFLNVSDEERNSDLDDDDAQGTTLVSKSPEKGSRSTSGSKKESTRASSPNKRYTTSKPKSEGIRSKTTVKENVSDVTGAKKNDSERIRNSKPGRQHTSVSARHAEAAQETTSKVPARSPEEEKPSRMIKAPLSQPIKLMSNEDSEDLELQKEAAASFVQKAQSFLMSPITVSKKSIRTTKPPRSVSFQDAVTTPKKETSTLKTEERPVQVLTTPSSSKGQRIPLIRSSSAYGRPSRPPRLGEIRTPRESAGTSLRSERSIDRLACIGPPQLGTPSPETPPGPRLQVRFDNDNDIVHALNASILAFTTFLEDKEANEQPAGFGAPKMPIRWCEQTNEY
jgi:hypothetical protein